MTLSQRFGDSDGPLEVHIPNSEIDWGSLVIDQRRRNRKPKTTQIGEQPSIYDDMSIYPEPKDRSSVDDSKPVERDERGRPTVVIDDVIRFGDSALHVIQ